MIVAERELKVESSGLASRQFEIAMNRKMFKILSSGLYADKVKAVVRELSTNAADAHVAAGTPDVKFNVHLPNALEPYFEVKDFGTGLSETDIYGVYTKYGVSNKTDSNEYTGCLGLGSKSPFAYTDSFTVESRVNGEKRVYTAFLNKQGFPSLSDPLTVEQTDEPNGLTVRFPVKSSDFHQFRQKAVEVLKWFKVCPEIGGQNVEFPPQEYLYEDKTFRVNKGRVGQSYAVMGNVAYPIAASSVVGYGSTKGDRRINALLSWGVELSVGIGDVDITASRESLSYEGETGYLDEEMEDDEKKPTQTVPFLKAALTAAIAELEGFVTKDIAAQPTIWQARRALNKVRTSFHDFDFNAVWNGQVIEDHLQIPADKATAQVLYRKSGGRGMDGLRVSKDVITSITADGTPILLNDERGGFAAVRRFIGTNPDRRVVLLSDVDAQWLTETGLDEVVIKTSSLPKLERVYTARGTAVRAKVYEFVGGSKNAVADYWKAADVDLDDGGVYVEILYFKYRIDEKGETEEPRRLARLKQLLESVSGHPVTIYGVRPADRRAIDESEGEWTPLKDYVERIYDKVSAKYMAAAQTAAQYGELNYGLRMTFAKWKNLPDGLLKTFAGKLKDAHDAKVDKGLDSFLSLHNHLDKGEIVVPKDLTDMQKKVMDRYPLFAYLDFGSWRNDENEFWKNVREYVQLIDG